MGIAAPVFLHLVGLRLADSPVKSRIACILENFIYVFAKKIR